MSDWSRWFNKPKEGKSFSDIKEEGNLSAVLPGGPAERARQLGLQSNGRGSYIDPNTGQVAARTVNNELVFYDQNGGAIADSSGGSQLSRAQPSWGDPITGMLVTPPGKAESPAEIASIPDAVPATPPAGYNDFMKRKKDQQYQMNAIQPQPMRKTPEEAEEEEQQQQDMTPDQGQAFAEDIGFGNRLTGSEGPSTFGSHLKKMMAATEKDKQKAAEEPAPADKLAAGIEARKGDVSPEGLAKAIKKSGGVPETMADRIAMMRTRRRQALDPNLKKEGDKVIASLGQEKKWEQLEKGRREKLAAALDRLMAEGDGAKGAGKNNLTVEDAQAFKNYILNGPQNKSQELSPEELDWAMGEVQTRAGDKWKSMQSRLKGKGDPAPARKVVERAREVLGSYLSNLGQSAIDGSPLPFSDSELDHGVSLANGGEDVADNWRWLPTRFNQFKGDLEDKDLLANIQKRLEADPTDENLKIREQQLKNKVRGDWRDRFEQYGAGGLNVADIMEMRGATGLQQLKSLAESHGISYYKDRGVTRSSGRAGGGTSLGVEELQQKLIKELGIPDEVDVTKMDESMFDILQELEDQRADLQRDKRKRSLELRQAKKNK